MLAYITGTVDQELLLRNEYLAAENRILKAKVGGQIRLTNPERITLASIAKKLGRKALEQLATIVRPDTLLAWHRRLVAKKFDGSAKRGPGRPRIKPETEKLVVRLARQNRSWGYDRIVGALANLGITISDRTVGAILKRHNLPPAPERSKTTSWRRFVRSHMDVLAATDFFTVEVWGLRGLVTYYVLFFINLASRRVHVAGITANPKEPWMVQVARNVTMNGWGFLADCRYLIHDRDAKFSLAFRETLKSAGIKSVMLPPKSPNLNAYAERWVRSIKQECLSRLICFGEGSLRKAITEYVEHYDLERNHQGKGNTILCPVAGDRVGKCAGPIRSRERLGGLLRFYHRGAA